MSVDNISPARRRVKKPASKSVVAATAYAEALSEPLSEAAPAGVAPVRADLSRACEAASEQEYTVPRAAIRGRLPETLRGTFFRMGPGRYAVGDQAFGHAFDGDGMLHSVTFADEGVRYLSRYVQTPKYKAETRAERIVYRSVGHNAPGGMLRNMGRPPANCANTSLIWHGGHLLALWEGGRPYALDPSTLETLGEFDYGGRLGRFSAFSAHGKVDPRTGYYYNFGVGLGLKGVGIDLYRIDPRGCLDRKAHFPIRGGIPFCHDFALTEHYAIFFVCPVHLRHPLRFVLGLDTAMENMVFEADKPTHIYVVSLSTLEVVRRFETEGFIAVHYDNCWEEGRELVINMTRFSDWDRINTTLSSPARMANSHEGLANNDKSALWRYRLDLVSGRARYERLPGHDNIEFMQWDRRRSGSVSRISYANAAIAHPGAYTFNAIQRLDLHDGSCQLHDFGPGTLISEAVFVERSKTAAEQEGYLVTAVYRAVTHTTDIVVLDAQTLDELAVAPLSTHIPLGFHCGYTARAFR